MATILLPSKWATMPSQPVELNGSNPFVQDLVFAMLGNPATGYQDFVSGKFPTIASAISNGIVGGGFTAKIAANSTLDYGHTLFDDVTAQGTLLLRTRPNGNAKNYRAFTSREDSATGDGVWLLYDDLNNASNGFNVGSNNSNYRVDSTSGALGTNSEQYIQTFGFNWDGTNVVLFANDAKNKSTALALPVNTNSGRTTKLGSSDTIAADVSHAYAFRKAYNLDEWRSLYNEPYQLFKPSVGRIYFIGTAAGVVDATGTGNVSGITLTSPTGSATAASDATGSGSIASEQLVSPTGAASTTANATASGSISTSQLTAPTGASVGHGNASGSLDDILLGSVAGDATASSNTSGNVSNVSLSNVSATASGYADATGSIANVSLTSVSGFAIGDGIVSSSIATCTLVAPTGNASSGVSATGSGSLFAGTLTAPQGVAVSDGGISASIASGSLVAPSGTATAGDSATATGSIASLSFGVVTATISSDSIVSSSIAYSQLYAPNGYASTNTVIIVPRVIINLQQASRIISIKSSTRTINVK